MNKQSAERFFVTTPIYYVNFKPHIGTSYTTILADVACRFKRFMGQEALLVTGSDEHSQNIADLAVAADKTPLAYCDEMIPQFEKLWDHIDIQSCQFERTSSERHHQLVKTFWQRIHAKGDVYQDTYAGWYHTSDNRYLDEDEVPEKPEEHPRLKWLEEEAYYFRLSKYQDWLKEFHAANPEFVVPEFRRNEMLSRIEGGLRDICISRTSTDWGIPLPWDDKHVCWVWAEALLLYMTGSGFDIEAFERTFDAHGKSSETREPLWETTREDLKSQPSTNFWPCDLHMMAKDIPWFHAVIWPAILASYGAPIPRQELVHGYWNFDGEKMSKSLGNVVDPYDAEKLVGVDGLRYFLMREVPVGLDGNFSHEALLNRFNYDLANDLGNLVHRTVSMLHQLFEGKLPGVLALTEADEEIEGKRQATIEQVLALMPQLKYSESLQAIWALVGDANKYIDLKKPWELKKKPERHDEVATVFNRLVNVIRTVLMLAYPVIPRGANEFWQILNLPGKLEEQTSLALEQTVPDGHQTNESVPVYRRVDTKALLKPEPLKHAALAKPIGPAANPDEGAGLITIDEFFKCELRVAEITLAEKVEKADKLLRLEVYDGHSTRQVVAGIAQWYPAAELVGKLVVLVANLKPAKLRGLLSEGMLLAASDEDGNLALVSPEKPIKPGGKVK